MRSIRLVLALCVLGLVLPGGARAAHDDGFFKQPVWFEWEQLDLDVLIVPPNHCQIYNYNGALNGQDPNELNPLACSYLRAMEDSIADWDRAIADYGSVDLRERVRTNVFVIGRDDIPQEVLRDPEVIVFTDETKGTALGVAVSTRPCLVDNSKLFTRSMSYEDMFNINAQEYGHCLGLSHVPGDARGTKANGYRDGDLHDPMNGLYPHTPGAPGTDLHCVSNLNVAGLERVFARQMGTVPRGGTAEIPIDGYVRPEVC